MLFFYKTEDEGTYSSGITTYEKLAWKFPFFRQMVPDEEYAHFNEFESLTLKINRSTYIIRRLSGRQLTASALPEILVCDKPISSSQRIIALCKMGG